MRIHNEELLADDSSSNGGGFGDEVMGQSSRSSDGSNKGSNRSDSIIGKDSSKSEVTIGRSDSSLSFGESSPSSSETSFDEVFKDPTPANKKKANHSKYRNMLLRAVKRQILLNEYRKALLSQFKVSSAMLLAMD